MQHDYYSILGVASDADFETLRRAFRQRALECHPDRGGSHEAMLLVNEAWSILSNPVSRRNYDSLRSKQGDEAFEQTFARDVQAARQEANQYPRRWAEFDTWLNRIASDFSQAEYGTAKGPVGSEWPTAGSSISG